ncbi:MAG: helix-turn-helix transcriptional regulator [Faecalibacterium prausnitzii]|uniref:Helix-turn-helix transcriptional regulator n=1 Tax=Faecalibacterium prausnitzii TaxID=853 RepID=A0A9E1DRW8_9FIRM|nr:helix-turn-helix transcriptional regulator [Faecalibacterium prausnitzii]
MTNSKISLAAARVNAGYTQKEVAKRLNMGERTIQRWESGKTAPTVDKFIELCRLYNCPATTVKY